MANSGVSMTLPRGFFFSANQSSSPLLLHSSSISFPSIHSSFSLCSSSSSSSSSPPVVQDDAADEESQVLTFSGCKACGKEKMESGCNGDGRIQGGIATFPGFGWWPIKAYRPCPAFLASGGRYERTGQSMDEVAFGSSSSSSSRTIDDDVREKKPSPRKFKR